MKILHLVAGELTGGAARGAYWLHKGLLDMGVDSHLLTTSKETYGDGSVTSLAADKKGKLYCLARGQIDASLQYLYRNRQRVVFSAGLFGFDFTRTDLYKQADIVHLHWICGGMVNMRHLARVDKPVVWTMRDMWPMTGGCHYAMDCKRYESGCGFCKQLNSQSKYDLSYFILKRKRASFSKNMKMVGISHWLSECAKKSFLFRDFDIRTIHNNVNINDFFSIKKSIARDILDLPDNKKIILTGAQNLKDFYKGFDKYLEAINKLKKDNKLLLFFGNFFDENLIKQLGFEYKSLSFLHDIVSLRLVYSASDVFIVPSLMDAFGKTLAESMACGTPVVCFNATGPKDIVDHKINGYLAKPFDTSDLAAGIDWVLSDDKRHRDLCIKAREKAVNYFDIETIAKQYAELYGEILVER